MIIGGSASQDLAAHVAKELEKNYVMWKLRNSLMEKSIYVLMEQLKMK